MVNMYIMYFDYGITYAMILIEINAFCSLTRKIGINVLVKSNSDFESAY